VNAPWSRHVALIATIAAVMSAGCAASAPTGSPVAAVTPSASAAAPPSPSVAPTAAEEPSSPEPSATESDPAASEGIDGTAGPDCGTGLAGLLAHRDEVPAVLHFGGATIEFTTVLLALRNGTYGADDSIPAGVGLTSKEIAVKVAPGTHVLLRGDGLVLMQSLVRVVPWSTVSFEGGLGASSATPVDLQTRLRTDGSISVSAPREVGDYMVQFGPRFHSACLEGDGSAYGRIKIVAP